MQKEVLTAQYKLKIQRLDHQLKQLQESNSNYVDKIMNLEKGGKALVEQIEMLKKRNKKLAQQRGKFDAAI